MARLHLNFKAGTLSADASNVATTLHSASYAALPEIVAPYYLPDVLDPLGEAGNPEIVWYTAHTAGATSVTAARGQEGTIARAHLSDTKRRHGPTAADFVVDGDYINIADYGAHPTVADNAVPVNLAIADAVARGINTILCPDPLTLSDGLITSYPVTTSINFRGASGLHFVGRGGIRMPFGFQPTVNFNNTVNTNPIFDFDPPAYPAAGSTPSDGVTFDGIGGYSPAGSVLKGNWMRGFVARRCSFISFANAPAIDVTNSFWFRFDDCVIYNGATTTGCVKARGLVDGNPDITSAYLFDFNSCVFAGGPFLQYDFTVGAAGASSFNFNNCDGENQSGDAGMFVRLTKTGAATGTFTSTTIRDCGAYDPISGASPWTTVSLDTGMTVNGVILENSGCANANTHQMKVRSGAANIAGVRSVGGEPFKIVDSAGALLSTVYGFEAVGLYGRMAIGESSAGAGSLELRPDVDYNRLWAWGLRGENAARLAIGFDGYIMGGDGTLTTPDVWFTRVASQTWGVKDNNGIRTGRGATGARPVASVMGAGTGWFDTTLGKPIWSNGSIWVDSAGVAV